MKHAGIASLVLLASAIVLVVSAFTYHWFDAYELGLGPTGIRVCLGKCVTKSWGELPEASSALSATGYLTVLALSATAVAALRVAIALWDGQRKGATLAMVSAFVTGGVMLWFWLDAAGAMPGSAKSGWGVSLACGGLIGVLVAVAIVGAAERSPSPRAA